MRRRILTRALLLLALGVITTITVASTLSALASHWSPGRVAAGMNVKQHTRAGSLMYRGWSQRWPGAEMFAWRFMTRMIIGDKFPTQDQELPWLPVGAPAWSCIHDMNIRSDAETLVEKPMRLYADWIAGFPLPALRGRLTPESLTDTQHIQFRGPFHGGEGTLRFRDSTPRISIGDGLWLTGHLFPLIPIWSGFLLDTLLYAATWGAALAAFIHLRRTHRLRRNLCPHCAYDLCTTPQSAPCPECGRPQIAH